MPFQKILPFLVLFFAFCLGLFLGRPAVLALDKQLYPSHDTTLTDANPTTTPSRSPLASPSVDASTETPSPIPTPSARSPVAVKSTTPVSVTKASPTPKFTCAGVTYNGQCLTQTCIDLDAPGWKGTDGNQYPTKSSVLWVDPNKKQFQNEDYCNENGNLVEFFCVEEEGQLFPIAINVSDSQCQDGHTAN